MNSINNHFSEPVTVFQDIRLPEPAIPVGYAALIHVYELQVPLPLVLSSIGTRHSLFQKDNWKIFTPRHIPDLTLEGQLVFALKYEGLDLLVLKKLFEVASAQEILEMIVSKPTSSYMRRIWFLYEWLLNQKLDLDDAKQGNYVNIVDEAQQYASEAINSTRHRVKNNLPGTREFCPLIFKTPIIEAYIQKNLSDQAQQIVGNVSADIMARTAAFLLLKDSKSSYAIEGEAPAHNRIQRWGKAIAEAGKYPLDLQELLRLQKVVIGDSRFIHLGLRDEGGFIGIHEQENRMPLPDHISARHEDLSSLIQGIIDFDHHFASHMDAVLAAAVLAFGFVYIHPFEDGNGRIHRYLMHHILSMRQFNPSGVIFPVSAAILSRIDEYRAVLESYSRRLLPFIKWEPTEKMNVRVLNDTADFYRYFDATRHVEFLYSCVEQTIHIDLPEEIEFLKKYDAFKLRIESFLEMPSSTINLLFSFLKQNEGKLSKRAKDKEFSALEEHEITYIEDVYNEIFV
ncbi:MAG: Fic family protein [Pseudomonadota bacterium]